MKDASTADRPSTADAARSGAGAGLESSRSRSAAKERGVLFSFVGIALGLLVILAFGLAGFWRVSLAAWASLAAGGALLHAVLWLVPRLGWDRRLRWDPNYLYLPWACVVVFFNIGVYCIPDARSLIPFGFLVNLLLLAGIAGFREVLAFSVAMSGGYFAAVLLLVRRGEPLSLAYEGALAVFYLAVGVLAAGVLGRLRRHRWELAQMRRRLTLAIRGSGAGWWDTELDPARPGEIPDQVHLSPELKALIGFADDEFPNSRQAWHARIHEEDRDRVLADARRQMEDPAAPNETTYRIRARNGELRILSSHSRVERSRDGVPLRWSGLEWDITERERTQEALRRLSQAVEQSPSLVIITSTEGRIEYVNPKFCRTSGYAPEEVLGRDPNLLAFDEEPPAGDAEMWRALRAGEEWHGEFRNRRKDGEPYVVISSISPIRNSAGQITHFLAVQEDVTERREVEAKLQQAQRMESVGQLVSGVAHDFNNLLTAVIGFADLGLASVAADAPVHEHLTEIRKAGESAGELTRQLLAFGRQQILKPEILDLNDVVRGVEGLLRRTLGEHLELVLDLAPDLWRVQADPTSLEQVLVNLAANARDAMPDGGRLTIATANLELREASPKSHPSLLPGAYAVVSVVDTGRGMDEKTRNRLFEPFFTTKKRGRGTGLGLSTVYGIVRQSGGLINVVSEPGRGARFDIHLPRSAEPESRAKTDGGAPEVVVGREAILLVEDDPRVRDLVARALDSRGYRVVPAANGGEALERWAGEPFDLLLTDIVMPGMSGIELAAAIGRERADLKVLFMSGYADKEVAGGHATEIEAPFLPKPFRVEELLRKVREVLEGAAAAS